MTDFRLAIVVGTVILGVTSIGIMTIGFTEREKERTAQVAISNHCSQVIEDNLRGRVLWKCPTESITK